MYLELTVISTNSMVILTWIWWDRKIFWIFSRALAVKYSDPSQSFMSAHSSGLKFQTICYRNMDIPVQLSVFEYFLCSINLKPV